MKKVVIILITTLISSALASTLTIQFRSVARVVDTIEKNGKLLSEAGELGFGFGIGMTVQGDKIKFYLGKKAQVVVDSTQSGNLGWQYVDALAVAKGLGYTAKLEKVTDKNGSRDVLNINYPQKITCEDFTYWEDAQKFYNASSNWRSEKFDEQDPYNIDRSKDKLACENLPRTR